MQQMLRRTVTVGTKYALHIWTGFLLGLAVLLATFILLAAYGHDFTVVAWVVIGYSSAGMLVASYALSRIQGKAEQIKSDLAEIHAMQKRLVQRYYNGGK